jgi:hypothetical protein
MANNNLVNLLYYTDKDPLSQPYLTEEQKKEEVYNKLIKIIPRVGPKETAHSIIAVRVVNGSKIGANSEFRNVKISVEVFVPLTQWIIKDTNLRPFAILGEIEESVEIYEAIVKTGNDVFDTILTEKSLYCKKHGIVVSCVADGSQLGFIDTIDLYAILGNAMDNAIEAVEKIEEKEKRQIDVMIYRQHNFLVMNIINPLSEQLIYEDGLLLTKKADKFSHGFGLRSIRQILRKYEGFLNISEEDGCFSLKMLIPIQLKVTT